MELFKYFKCVCLCAYKMGATWSKIRVWAFGFCRALCKCSFTHPEIPNRIILFLIRGAVSSLSELPDTFGDSAAEQMWSASRLFTEQILFSCFGGFFAPRCWQAACLPHCIGFFGCENWESCRSSKLFWWSVSGVVSISFLPDTIRSNTPPAWPKQRHCSCWAPCASSCAAQLSCSGAQRGANHCVMGVSPVPTLPGGREG